MWCQITMQILFAANAICLQNCKKWKDNNKRVRNLAVRKEPWDLSEVITDKHRINEKHSWVGPQKMYCSHVRSAAEMACLSWVTCSWRIRKWNTELAYFHPCHGIVPQSAWQSNRERWARCGRWWHSWVPGIPCSSPGLRWAWWPPACLGTLGPWPCHTGAAAHTVSPVGVSAFEWQFGLYSPGHY